MPLEEETYRTGIRETIDRMERKIDNIDTKVTYTNGKVRKIIMSIILLGGILIGQAFSTPHDIISLIIGLIH